MNRTEFTEKVQFMVRDVGQGFTEPNEDWMPVVITVDEKAKMGVAGVPDFFENSQTKEMFAQVVLPNLLKRFEANRYALVTSAWILRIKTDEWEEQTKNIKKSLSEHPDHEECVMLCISDKDGDEFYSAPILRDGEQPPVLGEWEKYPEGSSVSHFAGKLRND